MAAKRRGNARSAGVAIAFAVFLILVLSFVVYSATSEVGGHNPNYIETVCSTSTAYAPASTTTVGSFTSVAYTSVSTSVGSCTTQRVLP